MNQGDQLGAVAATFDSTQQVSDYGSFFRSAVLWMFVGMVGALIDYTIQLYHGGVQSVPPGAWRVLERSGGNQRFAWLHTVFA